VIPDGNPRLTLKQLRYAFRTTPSWTKDLEDDSKLVELLKSLQEEDKIPLNTLILLGLLLCSGSAGTKAEVFYRML
jgi:hypothetical protein